MYWHINYSTQQNEQFFCTLKKIYDSINFNVLIHTILLALTAQNLICCVCICLATYCSHHQGPLI